MEKNGRGPGIFGGELLKKTGHDMWAIAQRKKKEEEN